MSIMPVLNTKLIAEIDEANNPTPDTPPESEEEDEEIFKSEDETESTNQQESAPVIKIKQVTKPTKSPKKKKSYPHLDAARKKGLETRRRRAAEKKIEKAKLKEEKERMKAERLEVRKNKQRDRSKEDYWKKKLGVNAAAKTTVEPEVVVNAVAPPPKKTPTTPAGPAHFNGMTYEKFSGFMDSYNGSKIRQYNEIQAKKKLEKEKKELEEKKKRSSRLGNPIISRRRTKGMFVENNDYPNDLFF